jgi:hypothetical protein
MALVQVRTPGSDATQPTVTAGASATSGATPRLQVVALSFAAILVFWLSSIVINDRFKPTALVIPAGVSLFAVFYAVTQGLERLLEPLSSFFYSTKEHTESRNAARAAAVNVQTASEEELPARLTELAQAASAVRDVQADRADGRAATRSRWRHNLAAESAEEARLRVANAILPALNGWDGQDPEPVMKKLAAGLEVPQREVPMMTKKMAVDLAAAAQAELDQRRADKAVAYWAVASILGLLVSAALGLYLLHVVGLRGDGVGADGTWTGGIFGAAGFRHMLDLLLTGLAIGGGTKPLHDLISNLQAAKESKKDPSEAG